MESYVGDAAKSKLHFLSECLLVEFWVVYLSWNHVVLTVESIGNVGLTVKLSCTGNGVMNHWFVWYSYRSVVFWCSRLS
jgi:hypothetical protein